MTYTDIVLIALVWAVLGLAVAVWRLRRRLRRDVHQLDEDFWGLLDASDRADERMDRHHLRLLALEDSRSRTADLDVPDVDDHPGTPDQPTTPTYRPVPDDFNRNR
ncbi:hypothetical protein [Corynebacterium sp.]|uniref:hypothetical protein n=1 Tax=Corynebacterium sp. TaxID=1720 RepID=UPI003B3A9AE2